MEVTRVKEDRSQQIVFFDLETTIPTRKGQLADIIEFGAIVVDKFTLVELQSFSTLLYSDKITERSHRCNGITEKMVASSPKFASISARVYELLNGRIWAGHNIQSFDRRILRQTYESLQIPCPEPAGIIDTLPLFRRTFAGRTDNFKLDTLGKYFGQPAELHRAVADCRLNLEVLKCVSTTLFLEQQFTGLYNVLGTDTAADAEAKRSRVKSRLHPHSKPFTPSVPTASSASDAAASSSGVYLAQHLLANNHVSNSRSAERATSPAAFVAANGATVSIKVRTVLPDNSADNAPSTETTPVTAEAPSEVHSNPCSTTGTTKTDEEEQTGDSQADEEDDSTAQSPDDSAAQSPEPVTGQLTPQSDVTGDAAASATNTTTAAAADESDERKTEDVQVQPKESVSKQPVAAVADVVGDATPPSSSASASAAAPAAGGPKNWADLIKRTKTAAAATTVAKAVKPSSSSESVNSAGSATAPARRSKKNKQDKGGKAGAAGGANGKRSGGKSRKKGKKADKGDKGAANSGGKGHANEWTTIKRKKKEVKPPPNKGPVDERIVALLDKAIESKDPYWISYQGGHYHLIPRQIHVKGWVHRPRLFLGTVYPFTDANSNNNVHFATRKVADLRPKPWGNSLPPTTSSKSKQASSSSSSSSSSSALPSTGSAKGSGAPGAWSAVAAKKPPSQKAARPQSSASLAPVGAAVPRGQQHHSQQKQRHAPRQASSNPASLASAPASSTVAAPQNTKGKQGLAPSRRSFADALANAASAGSGTRAAPAPNGVWGAD